MSEIGTADRPAGLRERKKAKTRAAIREHALRLFREQGYSGTTVEQIAEAAEVSPATFYRYFPTKEDVVLQDDLDVLTVPGAGGAAGRPGPRSRQSAPRCGWPGAGSPPEDRERFRETTALTLAVPEVRARALDEFTRTLDIFAAALAKRTGRDPSEMAVRALAGAIFGVITAITLPTLDEPQDIDELFDTIDAGLAQLEAGLPL